MSIEFHADKIICLTQVIKNNAECELDYGTLKTLKMIDDNARSILDFKRQEKV